jgi:hypothetical protein
MLGGQEGQVLKLSVFMSELLKLQDISFYFDKKTYILKDINFSVST